MSDRTVPSSFIRAGARSRSAEFLASILLLILCGSPSGAQIPFWERAGGVPGFTVSTIALNWRDDIIAGGEGGLYRSTNGGANWTLISRGSFLSLLLTPIGVMPDRILAGTDSAGLLYSSDDGDHWSTLLPGRSVYGFAITGQRHLLAGTSAGLFQSTDVGATWNEIFTGLDHPSVRVLLADSSGDIFAGMEGAGIYYSSDGGASWSERNEGLFNPFVRALAFNKNGALVAGSYGGIYVSTDRGLHWSTADLGTDPTQVYCLLSHRSGTLLAGVYRDILLRSDDGGFTWKPTGNLLVNGFWHKFLWALAQNSTGVIYGGSEGGVYASTDVGRYWDQRTGSASDAQMMSMTALPAGDLLAAPTTAYLLRSTDRGDNWSRVAPGFFVATKRCFLKGPGSILYTGTDSGVFRSTDLGVTWFRKDTGLSNYYVTALATTGIGHVFAATETTTLPRNQLGGVYRSTDDCENWTLVNNGLSNHRVHTLIALPSGDLFAGTDSGIFRSKNEGDLWYPVNDGLIGQKISLLAANGSGDIFAVTQFGLFRSTDGGGYWNFLSRDLSSGRVRAMTVNAIGHLFIGTSDTGVFRSTDNGNHWSPVNDGLGFADVRAFAIAPDGRIFAGTFGGGVYRSIRSTTPVMNSPPPAAEEFAVGRAYPNPCSLGSTIPVEVGAAPVRLGAVLFDMLGRKIRTIGAREYPPGRHEILLNVAGVANGSYLLRIFTGDRSRMLPLSVVR